MATLPRTFFRLRCGIARAAKRIERQDLSKQLQSVGTLPELVKPVPWYRGLAPKIYIAFLLTTVIPTLIAGAFGGAFSLRTLQQETLRNLDIEVATRAQGLGRFFDQLSAQLLSLSQSTAMQRLALAQAQGSASEVEKAMSELERDYLALAGLSKYLYQIRLLGADGYEWVRVDRRQGRGEVVPADGRQYKGDRYYFREAIARAPGELYVSPLDLNMEFGKIEQPERPVIRVATPIRASDGGKLGVLIFNIHADLLVELVQQMADARKGTAYLIDMSGHYMSRTAGTDAPRFSMDPLSGLAQVMPGSVARILTEGGASPKQSDGWIIAQAPIDFARPELAQNGGAKWRIALLFPEKALFFAAVSLYAVYIAVFAVLLATAVAGWLLSRRLLQPIADLTAETTAVATGDFSRRVLVSGDDEIAALGQRFNMMAARLEQAARERDSAWERLEEEVRDRTRDLEQERASLAAVIDHTADGILAIDVRHRIRLANAAALPLLAVPDAIGKRIDQIWPSWTELAQAAANGTHRRDLHLEDRTLSLGITQTAGGFIVVARDVSQERRLLDDRRMLDRQMFQLEKLSTLGELAMGLAHEIGNPLAGMKAVVQAMQYEDDMPDGLLEALKRLESEIDRLSGFLHSFHGFAAPQLVHPEACRLDEVLDDVLFWIRKDARSKAVTVEQLGVAGLPLLWADPNHLKQILLNLVINAVHAMPEGGRLTLSAAHDDNRVRIGVQDTGVGIDAADLPQIFEPFFTTRSEGSGLGLAIVRKIAEQHGASIAVSSERGRGTCFTLNWPLFRADRSTDV